MATPEQLQAATMRVQAAEQELAAAQAALAELQAEPPTPVKWRVHLAVDGQTTARLDDAGALSGPLGAELARRGWACSEQPVDGDNWTAEMESADPPSDLYVYYSHLDAAEGVWTEDSEPTVVTWSRYV